MGPGDFDPLETIWWWEAQLNPSNKLIDEIILEGWNVFLIWGSFRQGRGVVIVFLHHQAVDQTIGVSFERKLGKIGVTNSELIFTMRKQEDNFIFLRGCGGIIQCSNKLTWKHNKKCSYILDCNHFSIGSFFVLGILNYKDFH